MFTADWMFLRRVYLIALLLVGAARLQAQSYIAFHKDTLAKSRSETSAMPPAFQLKDSALQQDLQTKLTNTEGRQKLMAQLKSFSHHPDNSGETRKFYYNLTNVFARIKMYPLAMKCFYKSLDSSVRVINDGAYLGFTARDDSLLERQAQLLATKRVKSPKISYQQITQTFNDGKQAAAYAILIHIKQPIPGKRKVHKLADAGHSFITLIKYNTDTTVTSLSFGFYPKHHHPFAGTPLFPYSHSTFKNDYNYNSDETTGKFISPRTFDEILLMVKTFDGIRYNLNNKNCTDFVLDAALLADIYIDDTFGKWPLGHGNTPGITGQGILNNHIYDGCTTGTNDLFIDYDPKLLVIKDK